MEADSPQSRAGYTAMAYCCVREKSLPSKPGLILRKQRSTYQGGGQLHTKIFPGSDQQTILEFLILGVWGFSVRDDQYRLYQQHVGKMNTMFKPGIGEGRKQERGTW